MTFGRRFRSRGSSYDSYDLQRFVRAQDRDGTYAKAVQELRDGVKRSHWMWFVFPQVAGLGRSDMARRFAIGSPDEAAAYLAHPVLGPRLLRCGRILLELQDRTAEQIFGPVDSRKLQSSMTLFAHAGPNEPLFRQVLQRYFDGVEDAGTIRRI
jgi:uncharacterized protein (DUF1810 family)